MGLGNTGLTDTVPSFASPLRSKSPVCLCLPCPGQKQRLLREATVAISKQRKYKEGKKPAWIHFQDDAHLWDDQAGKRPEVNKGKVTTSLGCLPSSQVSGITGCVSMKGQVPPSLGFSPLFLVI